MLGGYQHVMSTKLAKSIGLSKALIIQCIDQQLNNPLVNKKKYNGQDWIAIDDEKWNSMFFPFWSIGVQRRFTTELVNTEYLFRRGKDYSINYFRLGLGKAKKKTKASVPQIDLFGQQVKKKTSAKAVSDTELMNRAIRKVVKASRAVAYAKYMKFAKELLAMDVTPNDIEGLYGKNGWWYKEDWRGKQGQAPNQHSISETIITAQEKDKKESTWSVM